LPPGWECCKPFLNTLPEQYRAVGLLKARGQQRTDATHVLASVRGLTQLELLGETFRATLNDLATVAPAWVQGIAPLSWYERYRKRIEDTQLPQAEAQRMVYAEQVGRDGLLLLDALDAPGPCQSLPEHPTRNPPPVTGSQHSPLRSRSYRGIADALVQIFLLCEVELQHCVQAIQQPPDIRQVVRIGAGLG
jgi:hypothetical protein